MQILTGTIINIDVDPSFQKKEVTLQMIDNQEAFIEFRGPIMIGLLDGVSIGETVQVVVSFHGNISKRSGLKFNNLVAKTIKKMQTHELLR